MLAGLDAGADLVCGWKVDRQDSLARVVASRLFNGVSRFVSGVELHDVNCGLKAYRREVTTDVPLYGELHRFIPLLAAGQGFRVTEQSRSRTGRAPSAARATAGRGRSAARWTWSR